jgi:ribonucleoside-diphosphate reductase alpha chain
MSRKKKLSGTTYQIKTGCGTLYVTINENDNKPFEIFATIGKTGGCAASQIEAIGRLISLGLRGGTDPKKIIKQLSGICCHAALMIGEDKIMSCADAIAKVIKEHIKQGATV